MKGRFNLTVLGNRVMYRHAKRGGIMEIQVIKPKKIIKQKIRVCAYCRVSTDAEEQENSLKNQMTHYEELIKSNESYEFVGVYSDFGISGFKESRPGFNQMVKDAKDGKIDLIITKSVSRLARNTVTVLKVARELKEQGVGIFFELQNINTLTEAGELLLTILSAFAQAESESARIGAQMVYTHKYEKGIAVQYLERSFGYTKSKKGEFIPDKKEAKWVRKIFEMAADGYTSAEIKRYLISKNVRTIKGAEFKESTVIRILENEIYKGDYIMHKHFVNEDRKLVRNEGQVDAWYVTDDHEPIVSKRLWGMAQKQLEKKREYLSTGSVVEELTEENYPYMNCIYCAECGYPLYRRIYSNGNRLCWMCSGQRRHGKEFCKGINVPDFILREWDFNDDIYIKEMGRRKGVKEFSYLKGSDWNKQFRKKEFISTVPQLCEENYPYLGKLYCEKCGSQLVRQIRKGDEVYWICNGWKRKGKKFCEGVRISDEIVRSSKEIDSKISIGKKETEKGKEFYYTRLEDGYSGKKCDSNTGKK